MGKIVRWIKNGSNLVDLLILVGLLIIISTTLYINIIKGLYLLGIILILVPSIFYISITKGR